LQSDARGQVCEALAGLPCGADGAHPLYQRFVTIGTRHVWHALIPGSVGAHSHGHATSSRFFWKDDIPALWGVYAPLTAAVHMRKPGARRQLDDFMDRARTQVADFQKASAIHSDAMNTNANAECLGDGEVVQPFQVGDHCLGSSPQRVRLAFYVRII
jgi:hypothetical protein